MEIPKNGLFLNITDDLLLNVNLLFGNRGPGKTFSILWHRLENAIKDPDHSKFIFMRDSETIVKKLASSGITSPIEEVHPELGHTIIKKVDGNFCFVHEPGTDQEQIIGYLMALSTFHNARGLDYSDVNCIIFDEMMPEEGTIIRKGQGSLWLNAYESICRNRELNGQDPVRVIFLSNTNALYSEILEDFGLSTIVENMYMKGVKTYRDDDVWVEFLENEEFTKAKANTLIHRLAKNAKFTEMALNNRFNDNMTLVDPEASLKGSKGLFTLDERYTCIRLSDGRIYFKLGRWKNLINYDTENDQEVWLYKYMFADKLRPEYITGNMYFDSIYTQRRVLYLSKI